MDIYHTSPAPITEINENGLFGPFLAFASSPYSPGAMNHVYRLELAESDIIDGQVMLHRDEDGVVEAYVDAAQELLDCDRDLAEDLLTERASIFDVNRDRIGPGDLGEMSWGLQRLAAEAARALGYRGVELRDEQGPVWFVYMQGHEHELIEITDEQG